MPLELYNRARQYLVNQMYNYFTHLVGLKMLSPLKAPLIALAAFSSLMVSTAIANAEEVPNLSQEQVEQIVHDYLMANPEVMIRSIDAFYKRQEEAAKAEEGRLMSNLLPMFKNSEEYPVGGNPNGSVTMVEFFDYQCGYCKRVFPQMTELMKDDQDLRVVFVELPILGPVSLIASQAALAAREQDKYMEFHVELMGARGGMNEDRIYSIADSVGLDIDKLKADMKSETVKTQINRNRQLSQMLNISGTPAFIIGDEVVRGAIDKGQMKALIEADREQQQEANG